jgi:hypothetical protein
MKVDFAVGPNTPLIRACHILKFRFVQTSFYAYHGIFLGKSEVHQARPEGMLC